MPKIFKTLMADRRGSSLDSGMKTVTKFFVAILSLGVLAFALIIVLGNLEDSSGFSTGSVNANRTADTLANITAGTTAFFTNAGTWFTLLSIVIIIAIVVLVIVFVRKSTAGGGAGESL